MTDLTSELLKAFGKATKRKPANVVNAVSSEDGGKTLISPRNGSSRQEIILPVAGSSRYLYSTPSQKPVPEPMEVHFENVATTRQINCSKEVEEDSYINVEDEDVEDDYNADIPQPHSQEGSATSCVDLIDDDIYGDLESSIFAMGNKDVKAEDLDEKLVQAARDIHALQHQNTQLTKENKNYRTNISSLEITAKGEIEKKNFIIKQLQCRLQNMTTAVAQKSNLSKIEIKEILKECHEAHHEANSQVTVEEIAKFIEQLTSAKPKSSGNKKQFKFGNMSLYFFREQVPFEKQGRIVQLESSQKLTQVSQQSTSTDALASCSNSSQIHYLAGENNNLKNPEKRHIRRVEETVRSNRVHALDNCEKLPLSNNENKSKEKRKHNFNNSKSHSRSKSPPSRNSSRSDQRRSHDEESPKDQRYRRESKQDYKDKRNKDLPSRYSSSSNSRSRDKRRNDDDHDKSHPKRNRSDTAGNRNRRDQ